MFIKTVAFPVLAAGAALAFVKVAAWRRGGVLPDTSARRFPVQRIPLEKLATPPMSAGHEDTLAEAAGVLSESSLPKASVLPIAFWDAASDRLDADEDVVPTPRAQGFNAKSYDSIDPEDLTLEWLTRATEAPEAPALGDIDDPAEVAAGSISMISEASRNASDGEGAVERTDEAPPSSSWEAPSSADPGSTEPTWPGMSSGR